jgi:hypothetical protein
VIPAMGSPSQRPLRRQQDHHQYRNQSSHDRAMLQTAWYAVNPSGH